MTQLVSVVVPVHDVRPYLSACLDSLLAQTHQNVEILAVDDGSIDGSGHLCDVYAAEHAGIRVVHQTNGGLSDARNAGLAEVSGEWVMFLDGDDWIEETAVSTMLAAAGTAAADVVVAGFHVDVHDRGGAMVTTERRIPPAYIVDRGAPDLPHASADLMNIVGYAWNKLYRRSLLNDAKVHFPVGVSLVEDILFNAPVLAHASRVVFLDAAFVHYIQRPRLTLGTRPQPQFAQLMSRASEATAELLTVWGLTQQRASDVIHDIELARVQWALRSVLAAGGPLRPRRAAAQKLLSEPAVRSVLERELDLGRLHGPRRWIAATQARGHALPTLAAQRLREMTR